MKLLKIAGIVLVVLLLLLGGGVLWLNHYLQTPAFKARVIAAAQEKLGSQVEVQEVNVTLFGGVKLRTVRLANPQTFSGDFFSADAFAGDFSWWPLLSKRVEVRAVNIQRPELTLIRGADGRWNYQGLGEGASGTLTETPTNSGGPALDVAIADMAVHQGTFSMWNENRRLLARMEGVDAETNVNFGGGRFSGAGTASAETVNVSNDLFFQKFATPIQFSEQEVQLPSVTAQLAGGAISGAARLQLAGGFKYALNLKLRDADLDRLLTEAKTRRLMTGRMQADVALEGTGDLPTIVGQGSVDVTDGKLTGVPLQGLLATMLFMPSLREIAFVKCHLDFSMANNQLQTPSFKLTTTHMEILANGVFSFEGHLLDHDLTLALAKELFAPLPRQVQAVFKDRGDGFLTLTFHVTGPFRSPKTDIPERAAAAGGRLLERGIEGIEKFFKREGE